MKVGKKLIEKLKLICGFSNWNVVVVEDTEIKSCGECFPRIPYKEAVIKLNPDKIKEAAEFGFRETLLTTLCHEFGELVMLEPLLLLPREVRTSKRFSRYRDTVADTIGRIIERQLKGEE